MEVKNVVPKTRNKKENNKTCCVKIVFVTLWIVCAVAVWWMCYLVKTYGSKQ